MLRQEAMKLSREIPIGLFKAGLLLGASPVPVNGAARIVVQFLLLVGQMQPYATGSAWCQSL